MVWVYVEDVDRFVDSLTWANYGEVFSHIWAASAYKGQLISEGNLCAFKSSKKLTFFVRISALASKMDRINKIKALYLISIILYF